MTKFRLRLILAITIPISILGCGKTYLEKKNDKALLIPTTMADMRAILDNKEQTFCWSPGLNVISGDEFTVSAQGFASLPPFEQNTYLWEKEIFISTSVKLDWNVPYKQVFYTNIVLEGLDKIQRKNDSEKEEWNTIKGTALFHRAFAFYNLSQTFAKVYIAETANRDLGIPIRLEPDVNLKSTRSTVQQTYDQITTDLKIALRYLPNQTEYNTRPNKRAGYALLSRVFLSMSEYSNAENYADSALSISKELLDYNTVDTTGTARKFPNALPKGNPEIIFYSSIPLYRFPLSNTLVLVENTFYKSFHSEDLRRALFFRDIPKNGSITFRGTYNGINDATLFAGLATDEMYLIKAECAARRNDLKTALLWLNDLLIKRYKLNKFQEVSVPTVDEVLQLIITERKKELFARGIRWTDLRRLNLEPRFAVTLRRDLNGKIYELPAGDNRYVFPIPPEEILGSGIPQNER